LNFTAEQHQTAVCSLLPPCVLNSAHKQQQQQITSSVTRSDTEKTFAYKNKLLLPLPPGDGVS